MEKTEEMAALTALDEIESSLEEWRENDFIISEEPLLFKEIATIRAELSACYSKIGQLGVALNGSQLELYKLKKAVRESRKVRMPIDRSPRWPSTTKDFYCVPVEVLEEESDD